MKRLPWMREGDPWIFAILLPILGILCVIGGFLLIAIEYAGRLFGLPKGWTQL